MTVITTPDPSNGTVATCQDLSATTGSRARGITGDDDGYEGVFDTALTSQGRRTEADEILLDIESRQIRVPSLQRLLFPPSTQEGVLIAT